MKTSTQTKNLNQNLTQNLNPNTEYEAIPKPKTYNPNLKLIENVH